MATFKEVQDQLVSNQRRVEIYKHLIEYITERFLPSEGKNPTKMLVLENRTAVPTESFEDAIEDITETIKLSQAEIDNIMGTAVSLKDGDKE